MLLADNGASDTLSIAIVSGIVTIIVAVLSLWATRTPKKPEEKHEEEPEHDDELVGELRGQVEYWKNENTKHLNEISRLERLCFAAGIDYLKPWPKGGAHRAETPGRTPESPH
jgi:hypothetical protein